MATYYLYTLSTTGFLRHKCQLSIVSDKIINNDDNFRIKSLSYSEKGAILCFIYFLFYTFSFNLEKHVQ